MSLTRVANRPLHETGHPSSLFRPRISSMRRRFAVVGSAHPRYLPYCRLEEVAIPLHVVCAKFSTGAEAVLSQGPIIEAVLASTAIPGVFPPVSARPLARMTHAITLMGAR